MRCRLTHARQERWKVMRPQTAVTARPASGVSADVEEEGLDITEHGERAYHY